MQLFEDGNSVGTAATGWNVEEVIVYTLKPGSQYKLTWKFYFWVWKGPFNDPCYVSVVVRTCIRACVGSVSDVVC